MHPATERICGGVGGRGGVRDCSIYEENRAYKITSAWRGRVRFTRAAAAAAGDSWKDSDVSIRLLNFDVLAISRDEAANSDYDDEDGGCS